MTLGALLAGLSLAAALQAGEDRLAVENALRHVERGELAEARRLLEQVVAARPDDASARYYLGSVLLELDEVEAALGHLEKAVDSPTVPAAAHFNLGLACERLGRMAEAARFFGEAWRRAPRDAAVALAYGRALISSGELEQALEPLGSAARAAPDASSARFHLGYARLQLGKTNDALDALSAAAELAPTDPQIRLFQGIAARRAGRSSLAMQALELVRASPYGSPQQKATALAELGLLAAAEGRAPEACDLFRQAFAVPAGLAGADRDSARLAWGESLLALGQPEEAVRVLEDAESGPGRAAALLAQGKAYRQLGNAIEARSCFIAAAGADVSSPEPWLALAEVEIDLNQPDSARSAALEALRRREQNPRAHYLHGRALLAAGDPSAAVAALERALALDGSFEGALYALGQAHARAGHSERARVALDRFREIQAVQAESYASLGHLTTTNRQGLLFLREGRYDEAAAWFRRVVRDAPESPVGHLNLAIALLRAGHAKEAVAPLEAARALDPEEPAVYRYLARAYASLGRPSDQRAAEEQYRRLTSAR